METLLAFVHLDLPMTTPQVSVKVSRPFINLYLQLVALQIIVYRIVCCACDVIQYGPQSAKTDLP